MKTNDVSDKTNASNGLKKDIRSQLGVLNQTIIGRKEALVQKWSLCHNLTMKTALIKIIMSLLV